MDSTRFFVAHTDRGQVAVRGEVLRDVPLTKLEVVEHEWSAARKQLKRKTRRGRQVAEHGHWNWTDKIASTKSGHHRLIAVEINGSIQGLMALLGYSRSSRLTVDAELTYVDFIESAPWNIDSLSEFDRYTPVGATLLAEAITISEEIGNEGRIGLHSLPQAESYYRDTLGMIDGGRDRDYLNLCYFEFASGEALQWRKKFVRNP